MKDQRYLLVADVGGTHTRIAMAMRAEPYARIIPSTIRRYQCKEWEGLELILRDYQAALPEASQALGFLCATAGYLQNGEVKNRNLAWPVTMRGLTRALVGIPVKVVNDFEAMAYATLDLNSGELFPILAGQPVASSIIGTSVVLGTGTGLGSAILVHGKHPPQVIPAEAGQIALAPGTDRAFDIFKKIALEHDYIATEKLLSGPGLLFIYQALCELDHCQVVARTAAEVTRSAIVNNDPLAVEALDIFCGQLGSLAADIALLVGARHGIFLGGGFIPQILSFLPRSAFAQRFFNKGVMRHQLQAIPVLGIRTSDHGLHGGAIMAGICSEFAA